MSDEGKIDCKYGAGCYRKNPEHLKKYKHPEKKNSEEVNEQRDGDEDVECITRKNKRINQINSDNNGSSISSSSSSQQINESDNKKQKLTIDCYFNKKSKDEITDSKKTEENVDIVEETLNNVANISFAQFITNAQKREKIAIQKEYEHLLRNPDEFCKNKFLVSMPDDFYHFWDWCTETCDDSKKPENKFINYDLEMVGPFDLLSGKFNNVKIFEPAEYLRHHRYYYDPPEFQTIFKKKNSGIHYGYWRDEPSSSQCFIAINNYEEGFNFKIIASNIFDATLHFLNNYGNNFKSDENSKFIKELNENSMKYENFENVYKKRNKLVVCKTFHKCGLVVPYDKKTEVGYRPLLETDENLLKMLKKVERAPESAFELLQPLVSAASIACDEGDFGTSLELGIDLFCFGAKHLHDLVLRLMINGYMMTKRPQFLAILKSHLQKREKTNVNILME